MSHLEENVVEAAVAEAVRAGIDPETLELVVEQGIRRALKEGERPRVIRVEIEDWR